MKVALQTITSIAFSLVFLGVALFLPAGTFDFWQAWAFIAVFAATNIVFGVYLAINDPGALQRRLKGGPAAETRPAQRIIIAATVVAVIAVLVIAALDHRFGWSTVPLWVVVIGDVLVFAGVMLAQLVIVQNAYAAGTVTIEADQPLISTGLYGIVRHPMYVGMLVTMTGIPLALGSYWALLAVPAAVPVLMARILDEESALVDGLKGYDDYRRTVPYRLVPGVW